MSGELCVVGLGFRLFDLPSGSQVFFAHVIAFIGSRAVDP